MICISRMDITETSTVRYVLQYRTFDISKISELSISITAINYYLPPGPTRRRPSASPPFTPRYVQLSTYRKYQYHTFHIEMIELSISNTTITCLLTSIRFSATALSRSTPPTAAALSDVGLFMNSRTPSSSLPLDGFPRHRDSKVNHFGSGAWQLQLQIQYQLQLHSYIVTVTVTVAVAVAVGGRTAPRRGGMGREIHAWS